MTKVCKHCDKSKHLEEFYNDSRYVDGKFPWCKPCKLEYARTNKVSQKWAKRNTQQAKLIKDRYVVNNKDRVRASKRKWSKANKAQELAKCRKYQADKIQRIPKWITKDELRQIIWFYVNCPEGYHVDHIVPLRGKNISGLHCLANLQYLPAHENYTKSNKY